ncbi:MAG: DUF3597 domain-containing protein [Chthoniobacterales bacterium]|nr:DUF3597 domain-containing protein [Chthoniobacterales bacterium]
MGLFNTLMTKIFSFASSGSATTAPGSSSGQGQTAGNAVASQNPTAATSAPAAASTGTGAAQPQAAAAPASQVDVGAVLDALAKKNPEKLDWKNSIVDLMKLVGMDSSLSARKELAQDLHYTGDTSDSAAMNVCLHQEVMSKLADNGAKIPQDLLKK